MLFAPGLSSRGGLTRQKSTETSKTMTAVMAVMLTLLFGLLLLVQGMSDTMAAASPFIAIDEFSLLLMECGSCIQVSKQSSEKVDMQPTYRTNI